MKKAAFMKDAVILCVITLVSGCLLGGAYQVTKEPIAQAIIAANNKAYKEVFNEAETFVEDKGLTAAIPDCNTALSTMDYGSVAVEKVLKAEDAGGAQLGYVITSLSNDSYGGLLKLSVGLRADGTITGIAFLDITDTPGLGMKAKEPKFKAQFNGRNVPSLTVTKTGSVDDAQINAISGATITSKATTNAVNAALYFLHNCIHEQEVG